MNKKFLFGVFIFLGLIGFLSMISAATFVNMVTPSNATGIQNISGSTYTLEAWINESADNVYIGNVSWYYQVWGSATWTLIGTTENTTNQSVFTKTWDTSALNGRNYTINATALNYDPTLFASGVNSTNITGNVTIDNTAPTIAVYGADGVTAYANGTSIKTAATFTNNLTLNISVTDAIFQTNSSDTWCFINVAGGLNHTVPYLENRWCNTSNINITDLSDGNNTINIYVNDTLNNMALNSTLVVQIDTTVPSASAVCSPSSVNIGDAFPCTCSTSDVTSGINSASSGGSTTSPDAITVVPSRTGVFTYTCSATDNGGLTASASATYTVSQPGGGDGPSGGTTWITHTISNDVFEAGYTKELSTSNRIRVQINSEDHYIGVLSTTATSATIQISSDPIQITLAAGEDAKVDVDVDGFYDVYVLLNGIIGSNADVTIQKINEEVPEGGTGVETTGDIETEETTGDDTSGGSSVWIWILIIAIILVIVAGSVKKKKK